MRVGMLCQHVFPNMQNPAPLSIVSNYSMRGHFTGRGVLRKLNFHLVLYQITVRTVISIIPLLGQFHTRVPKYAKSSST